MNEIITEQQEDTYFNSMLYEKVVGPFSSHLSINDNNRIFFSGQFGIGKTNFLKRFFGNQDVLLTSGKIKKKYLTIHLSPVDYVISSNEDIFGYIKYDILFDLLKKQIDFSDIELTFFDSLPIYLKLSPDQIISQFLLLAPLIGKDHIGFEETTLIVSVFTNLVEKAKEFWKNKIPKTDGEIALAYMEKISGENHSIYFQSLVTKIIEKKINELKNDQEVVLILDDLDRIDPEHIFRLLNIFAAHYDDETRLLKNKLGFDKIILVGDISNIRNIFGARYGFKADFNGYIDKFYSLEIFRFDNSSIIKSEIEKSIYKIKLTCIPHTRIDYIQKTLSHTLTGFLFLLIKHGHLNLRKILRLRVYEFGRNGNALKYSEYFKFPIHFTVGYIFLEILKSFFNSDEDIINTVTELPNNLFIEDSTLQNICFQLLLFVKGSDHHFQEKTLQCNIGNDRYKIIIEDPMRTKEFTFTLSDPGRLSVYFSFENFKEILINSVRFVRTLEVIEMPIN